MCIFPRQVMPTVISLAGFLRRQSPWGIEPDQTAAGRQRGMAKCNAFQSRPTTPHHQIEPCELIAARPYEALAMIDSGTRV